MQNIYITLPGNITLCLQPNGLKLNPLLLNAYLPALNISESSPATPDLTVTFQPAAQTRLTDNGQQFIIEENWQEQFPLDFYHLLYSLARLQLLKKQLFPVHAAGVSQGSHNILIVGHSGAGKTTIILKLQSDHGFKIFSGNKTVVALANQSITALGGTSTITVLKNSPQNSAQNIPQDAQTSQDRLAFSLATSVEQKSLPITALVRVRLNDGVAENNLITPFSALHKLYPFFLDQVNADTIIGTEILKGTPPANTQEQLVAGLKPALANTPVYQIIGSLDFICNSIANL